ncbi:MAG: PQQ-dependent sugar dehydrogenase [Pseudomonadota bacterium]
MNSMMDFCRGLSGLILFIAAGAVTAGAGAQSVLERIELPPGFKITLFADSVPDARSLARGDDGTVYVGTREKGDVYALRDVNGDGMADSMHTLARGVYMPNGVAFLDGSLYVAEVHRLLRFDAIGSHLDRPPEPAVVFSGFPKDAFHGWKYLRVGPDGKLYSAVGAPCNICKPEKPIYATITRLNPNGTGFEIFARGIRNSVGFDWHPDTQELYFTDNGRDHMGDDLPPEELNRAAKAGLHFGYPFCHAGMIPDPEFGEKDSCKRFTAPAWKFPAHVAPLGMRFYRGKQFPGRYRHQLFVAQHGSWNRSVPQGYRIVLVKFIQGIPVSETVFAEGWLTDDGQVLGRPVDVLEMADGSILVSDDALGVIYRISYQAR